MQVIFDIFTLAAAIFIGSAAYDYWRKNWRK